MPSLTFVMPHWLYWAGLIVFPAIALYLVRRQLRNPLPPGPSLFIAYLFWLTAGFMGIHRFYLRSALGLVFIPVFLGIIYCTAEVREVRDETSRTFAALEQANSAVVQAKPRSETPTPEETAQYAKAQADVKQKEAEAAVAQAVTNQWQSRAQWAGILMAVLLLVDAALLPSLVRKRRALEAGRAPTATLEVGGTVSEVHEAGVGEDPTMHLHTRLTDAIEWVNVRAGQYVAWWSLMAVFVYYYEVVARFIFNSPTNWVHESMFLMFGMQYMLSGAYAYREDQHVRVDVVYAKFSPRGKAIADIITSVFFFIFIGTMVVTGYRFAADSVAFGEHSFTEWGIQYWPVKLTIPIGAGLLLLQGVAKLIKDVLLVTRRGA
ncbi:MAG TPA: TRAP transporter small permease subunit [Casimicrobiaceae bacterium]|nr:TRAP transporter small permease subunit [Casimicrobiaceae bacterium]